MMPYSKTDASTALDCKKVVFSLELVECEIRSRMGTLMEAEPVSHVLVDLNTVPR